MRSADAYILYSMRLRAVKFDTAAVLRAARRAAGLTQAELASRTGTSQAAISDIERGSTRPTVERFDRLLRACRHHLDVVPAAPDMTVDPHDLQLLQLNARLTPAQRLAKVTRLTRLRGLAPR